MQNFVKPALIMVSAYLLINLTAYVIQISNNDSDYSAIRLKKNNFFAFTNMIQEKEKTILVHDKEIKSEKNSLKYDIPSAKIPEASKVVEVKILPSGEIAP